MDDFGSLIYIVMIIIGFVVSFFNNKNKKQKQAPAEAEPGEEPKTSPKREFKNILEEILGGVTEEEDPVTIPPQPKREARKPAPAPVPTPAPAKSRPEFLETKSDLTNEWKHQHPKRKVARQMADSPITKNEIGKSPKPKVKVDLRKAIIYSEILKRPEY